MTALNKPLRRITVHNSSTGHLHRGVVTTPSKRLNLGSSKTNKEIMPLDSQTTTMKIGEETEAEADTEAIEEDTEAAEERIIALTGSTRWKLQVMRTMMISQQTTATTKKDSSNSVGASSRTRINNREEVI